MQSLSLGLPFMAAPRDPAAWGRKFTTALDAYNIMAGMWLVGEDMPQETNRVTLSSVKDKHGLPVADVHFDDDSNDIAMRNHGYAPGRTIYEVGGCNAGIPGAALSLHAQSRHQSHERSPARWGGQQMGPDA